MDNTCLLCSTQSESLLWRDASCRVILIADADYPGYCRIVWHAHIREMTDLSHSERTHFMNVVYAVEAVLRELVNPVKINLTSLGNQTPHLHWHVIPRYRDDAHYPNPVWGKRVRPGAVRQLPVIEMLRERLAAVLKYQAAS